MTEQQYQNIGLVLAVPVALGVFIWGWLYAISAFGLFVGVSLGWIPAAILALMIAAATVYLWGLVLILGTSAFLIFILLMS